MVGAVLDGIQAEMTATGTDLGEIETPEALVTDGDEELPDLEAAAEAPANGDDPWRRRQRRPRGPCRNRTNLAAS